MIHKADLGDSVEVSYGKMVKKANRWGEEVTCEFNGETLKALPGNSPKSLFLGWCEAHSIKPSVFTRFGAETIEDACEKWDNGDSVWTVELGGLGPGYEQAIQVGVFQVARHILAHPKLRPSDYEKDEKAWKKWTDSINAVLHDVSKECGLGLSGAQAGAIKECVYRFFVVGYKKSLEQAGDDRHIQVSRHFPRVPKPSKKG